MRYVSVGRRFVALLIDGIVVGLLITPFHSLIDITRSAGYFRMRIGGNGFVPSLVMIAYLIVLEGLVGASVGKLAMGVRVVKEDGSKLDWTAAFVRNIARFVDAFPYFIPYLLGAIVVWNSPTRQRLGDRWANTVVVVKESLPTDGPGTGFVTTEWEKASMPPAPSPPPPTPTDDVPEASAAPGVPPLPPPPVP